MNSGIGEDYRDAFETEVEVSGQTIIIHKQFNTPNASSFEARGLKNAQDKNTKQVVFQFLDALPIAVGDVLQIKTARDLWRVIDTEDVVIDDTFINFDVFVEKIDPSGQPTRNYSRGNTFQINLSNSAMNLLFGDAINDVQHISSNVSMLAESGNTEIAEALKKVTEAVAESTGLSDEDRADVLQNLEELSRQAALEPNQRKAGVIKSILLGISSTLAAAGGSAEVWSTWGPAIRAYFGF